MTKAYLSVGSNLGQRYENLIETKRLLGGLREIEILRCSPFYETEPEGVAEPQGRFLNAVWEIKTGLSAPDLLRETQRIETELGRTRPYANAPRTVDIDILFYGEDVIETGELQVPHPRLGERYFVLKPLSDLVPNLKHPQLEKNVSQLMKHYLEHQLADHTQES